MIIDRIVKCELSIVDKLHDREPGWRLGNGADAEKRIGVDSAVLAGLAIAAREHDTLAIDYCDSDASNVPAIHERRDCPVYERRHTIPIEWRWRLCMRCGRQQDERGANRRQAESPHFFPLVFRQFRRRYPHRKPNGRIGPKTAQSPQGYERREWGSIPAVGRTPYERSCLAQTRRSQIAVSAAEGSLDPKCSKVTASPVALSSRSGA